MFANLSSSDRVASLLRVRAGYALLFLVVIVLCLTLDVGTARAQNADWTTLERQGGGIGWDNASAASSQTFVNVGGTGVQMTVN
ncbi:MAG: hypothetical protein KDD83_25305, partial [Caldilineaceae bacterium]|nr:hypothetical protein [Caldilineaceae bacterium]